MADSQFVWAGIDSTSAARSPVYFSHLRRSHVALARAHGENLRELDLEERRELLRIVIAESFTGDERGRARIQFSDHVIGGGLAFFAGPKRLASRASSQSGVTAAIGGAGRTAGGRSSAGRPATSSWLEAIDKRTGSPIALLASDAPDGLRFAGGAFITLKGPLRERFGEKLTRLAASRPALPGLRGRDAQWVKPELVVGVRHPRGTGALRHATVHSLVD